MPLLVLFRRLRIIYSLLQQQRIRSPPQLPLRRVCCFCPALRCEGATAATSLSISFLLTACPPDPSPSPPPPPLAFSTSSTSAAAPHRVLVPPTTRTRRGADEGTKCSFLFRQSDGCRGETVATAEDQRAAKRQQQQLFFVKEVAFC